MVLSINGQNKNRDETTIPSIINHFDLSTPIFQFNVNNTRLISGSFGINPPSKRIYVDWGDGISNKLGGKPNYRQNYKSNGNRIVKIYAANVNPYVLKSFVMDANNADISFNLADLPIGIEQLEIGGDATITGNISDLPENITAISLEGRNNIGGYTTWPFVDNVEGNKLSNTFEYFIHVPTSGGLSSDEVDKLLIDFDKKIKTWVIKHGNSLLVSNNSKAQSKNVITLTGTNAIRTSASDAAVASLTAKNVTVTTNRK
jgi:hypothetical protein